MAMAERKTGEGLNRVIGVTGLAATVVNNTIGAGIYALPAIVSLQMGAAGILDYAFCGLMLVAIMLCYAEIGSKVSASGGSYIYVEKAFGPFAGFIINWLFFVGWGILGSAALMNAAADSLSGLFPVFSNPLIRALFFFILLGSMVWIKCARGQTKHAGVGIPHLSKDPPAGSDHPIRFRVCKNAQFALAAHAVHPCLW